MLFSTGPSPVPANTTHSHCILWDIFLTYFLQRTESLEREPNFLSASNQMDLILSLSELRAMTTLLSACDLYNVEGGTRWCSHTA